MRNTSATKMVALAAVAAAVYLGLLSSGSDPARAIGASGETGSADSALTLFGGYFETASAPSSGTVAHPRYALGARRATCVVPKVRGKKLAAAKKSIRRHHCRVGKVKYRFSASVARRRVLTQNPPAHSRRKRNAKVRLVVSNGPCGSLAGKPSTISKVLWIVMENKDYASIYRNSHAPYETELADECGLATNYHAIAHPSLPNYIALTSGSTQGITDDAGPSLHPLDVPSIFHLVSSSARSYEESMPSNCYLSSSRRYAVKHNPWAYYVDGAAGSQRSACESNDVPLGSATGGNLYEDVQAGTLPAFSLVTPNLCDDMHSCPVATGDAYLQQLVPMILSGPDYQNGKLAIVIVFDENSGTSGNQVYTAVVSPFTRAETKDGTRYTHYSLLRTTEEILGLPLLVNAALATDMRSAFGW